MLPTCAMKNWIPLTVCLFALFTACHGNCSAPPVISFALLQDEFIDIKDFPVNSNVSYNCRLGYIRVPGTRNVITCLSDSTWSTPQDFCKRRPCGNPGEPENGAQHADDFLFGSRVYFTCNIGYNMESRRNYTDCQSDGTWSNPVPVCSIQECPQPHAITDGTYEPQESDYLYQHSVRYSCNQGLSLIGTATISCTSFGNWSADPPQCKEIKCPNPIVENAEKVYGFIGPYTLGSAVRFQCFTGFTMIGGGHVVCNASSEWDPPLPTCKGITVTNKPTTEKAKQTDITGTTTTTAAATATTTTTTKETGEIAVTQKPSKDNGDSGNSVGALVGNIITILTVFTMGFVTSNHFLK